MAETLLSVKDLHASVEDKEILKGINLEVGEGEIHVIMGPNGAGKSTLGNVLMGHPHYEATGGEVTFGGLDLLEESVEKRAKAGLFLTFQNPVEVPGVTLSDFLRTALEKRMDKHISVFAFKKILKEKMDLLDMDPSYAQRELNVGFSGGEKKKAEILQLLMLNPRLAILDETDSGLDVDAVRTVSKGVEEFMKDKTKSLLIITHSTRILEALHVDYTHVLVDGKIVKTGDASLVEEINSLGFEGL